MNVRVLGLMCLSLPIAVTAIAGAQTVDPKRQPTEERKFIEIDLPLLEGDVKVTGRSNLEQVIVRVYSGWGSLKGVEPSQQGLGATEATPAIREAQRRAQEAQETKLKEVGVAKAANDPARAQALECLAGEPVSTSKPESVTNGAFEILLKQRLNGGDCVVVEDARPPGGERVLTSAIARSVLLDLGRLRGYFSIGAALSQSRSRFSQADTFIGFTNDTRLSGEIIVKEICPASNKTDCETGTVAMQPYDGPLILKDVRWQLNAFADARVGFRLATTGDATGENQNVATGGEPVQPAFQRPDQLAFTGDQPGYFQIGLHAPISVKGMDWKNDGRLYSSYISPLFKWGVQSFDTPVVVSRVVEIDTTKPDTDTARFTTTQEDVRGGALPFWGAGVRVGIYRYELLGKELRQRQIANDPVAYFDLTWGRSSAFRSYRFARSLNDAETIETVTIDSSIRNRVAMEGRLKLPYLPALIGVDVNVRGSTSDEEPNEFRFVLAFRIDAQKALGRIFRSDALSQDR